MCGVAGFIDWDKRSDKANLIAMTNTLEHRGPDDAGIELFENDNCTIGLGHRRLSIIDLSPLGHQPMSYLDRYSIVFNGEIYNYEEIRNELIDLGYKFKSNSDTEVVMASFDAYGHSFVHKCIGMFAFVLTDHKVSKVYIYRDRAGIKPMYLYDHENLFLFASELKAFHQHPLFVKKIREGAVQSFLRYSYVPSDQCIFDYCYKLLPGHYIEIDLNLGTKSLNKYWEVLDYYNKPKLDISEDEAFSVVERTLKSACDYRMVADVPVGMFLSGGYDSSAVAALLQSERTDKVRTFTIGFENKGFNEAGYAKKVAEILGTDHTEYFCDAKEALDIIPSLAYYFDEPFADSSAIPTTLVSRLARKSVTVALSADAGDELFAGYERYSVIHKQQSIINKIPNGVFKAGYKVMNYFDPKNIPIAKNTFNFPARYHKLKSLLKENSPGSSYMTLIQYFSDEESKELMVNYKRDFTLLDTFNQLLPKDNSIVNFMTAMDYKTYLVDDILTKVDRATMSVSLEGREPLLDHRLIELAAQLPDHLKFKNGNKKYILKQITHKYLPKKLMERPKMGFGIPLEDWFRKDLKEVLMHYLSDDKLSKHNLFNIELIQTYKADFLSGGSSSIGKLWLLLMFQMWYERWME